jgi:hypothetical protein
VLEGSMSKDPRVTTAAELDAMPPAERHQHFLESLVDPATLSEEQRAAIVARSRAVVAQHDAAGNERRAS